MKRIIILLITLTIISCSHYEERPRTPEGYTVIAIDSCEYIARGHWLAHKGNCKFCEVRKIK